MWVCSRDTRAGSTLGAACAAKPSANRSFQPRSSRVRGRIIFVRCRGRTRIRLREFEPAAQHLGDTPGLRDAAARQERRFGVEYFADLPDAGFVEMLIEPANQLAEL